MADRQFDCAVILAGMRTGSNLLEESLGSFDGVVTHGELFNPHFFGKPNVKRLFDLDMSARDGDPLRVLASLKGGNADFPVFRLFEDHDRRVLDAVLQDQRVAKIVLTRPPLDAWVSLKIARRTGQWWLQDARRAKTAKVAFDTAEFEEFSRARLSFYDGIRRRLQTSGQTAFNLSYDDLFQDAVIEGLGRWLGLSTERDPARVIARVQNPTPIAERLTNANEASDRLAELARPDLSALREYEPPRGPGLRGFVAAEGLPILYMPIRGAARDPVADWMEGLENAGEIRGEMSQKDLRRWWRGHEGHRSFTILRHPLRRAWDAFARHIMPHDGASDVKAFLTERYGLVVPEEEWSGDQARSGFEIFLGFLEANLRGQTSVRVDMSWTSQGRHLSAISGFTTPDVLMREDTLKRDIAEFCDRMGIHAKGVPTFEPVSTLDLAEIVTPRIEDLCARAYRRDMLHFGFGELRPQAA